MRWFDGGEFSRDSLINGFDGDITLENLLNDNLTRIRKYSKEFLILVRLSRMWYVPQTHLVFYEDRTKEGRYEALELCKVTQPFDQTISLINATVNHEVVVDVLPPPRTVIGGKSRVSKKPNVKKGYLVIKPPTPDASESTVGSSHDTADDLAFAKAGSRHLQSSMYISKAGTTLSS
ncbi:hypothetical protein Tco_0637595 [Tanacetum coccineum]